MTIRNDNDPTSNSAFFDRLLEQFRGVEGELPMATEYFAQAVREQDAAFKTTLTRIAKEKISNARILASILLELAKGLDANHGDVIGEPDYDQLRTLLNDRGISHDVLQASENAASQTNQIPESRGQADSNASREEYLNAYVASEDRQIAVYEELLGMTSDSYFIVALEQARQSQVKHRDEFAQLLSATRR